MIREQSSPTSPSLIPELSVFSSEDAGLFCPYRKVRTMVRRHIGRRNPVGAALSSLMWGNSESAKPGQVAHPNDLQLIKKALGGDSVAKEQLLVRLSYVPAMVYDRHRRCGSRLAADELEDVVQNTLMAVWRKLPSFEGRSRLETWTYGFCIHEIYRALERRQRGPRREDLEVLDPEDPSQNEPADDFDYLYLAIEEVGEPTATIVRMKHFEKLTFNAIGARMDMSPNTAKSNYYRGIQALRQKLAPKRRMEEL